MIEDVSRGGASSNGNGNGNHGPNGSPSTSRATSISTELLDVESEETPLSASTSSSSDSDYDDGSDSDGSGSSSSSSDLEEEETMISQQPAELEEFNIKTSLKTLKEKRRQFLDHIALISSSFLKKEHPASLATDEDKDASVVEHHAHNDNDITPQTDLSLPGRHFHVVTTAALPWVSLYCLQYIV